MSKSMYVKIFNGMEIVFSTDLNTYDQLVAMATFFIDNPSDAHRILAFMDGVAVGIRTEMEMAQIVASAMLSVLMDPSLN